MSVVSVRRLDRRGRMLLGVCEVRGRLIGPFLSYHADVSVAAPTGRIRTGSLGKSTPFDVDAGCSELGAQAAPACGSDSQRQPFGPVTGSVLFPITEIMNSRSARDKSR